ncbi:MAG: hypothetical protein EOO77_37685 [Oxalobacteraceae bacterium]|nr:MAG: hypothetical protein EOO77_37685 [Oxalobacteraceae bacterium]
MAAGKPQQNVFIQSFNGRLRDNRLDEQLFNWRAAPRQSKHCRPTATRCVRKSAETGSRFRTCRSNWSTQMDAWTRTEQGDNTPS